MVGLALRRPYTFIVMAMLILLATPFALRNMATDIFPEIDIPVVSIIWNYNGLSAQEMSNRITSNSERSITTIVNDIEHVESQTYPGVCVMNGSLSRPIHWPSPVRSRWISAPSAASAKP